MQASEQRLVLRTALIIGVLVVIRLIAAAVTPLTFDEAYYWTWSKALAGGYYDHPPMVAVVIRLGTWLAGDTQLGVRLASILLALPMSWAVYRSGVLLFASTRIGCTAALLLNATMLASAGTLIVTPDAPSLVSASFVLLGLAYVQASGRGVWWLLVGVAVGLSLLSKYTALFFGVSILVWLVAVPEQRRWFGTVWPYLGGLAALAVFSPVLVWNADHGWVSFIKQLGRAKLDGFNPAYISELIPTQFAFATPLVFILGVMGLFALVRRPVGSVSSRVLVSALFWPISLYFVWHAVHSRVEANWFAPVYPAFALAAAVAVDGLRWSERWQRTVDVCNRWAVASGALLFILLVVQANTGVLSNYRRDPTVRTVGVGMVDIANEVAALRQTTGATCILAPDYGTVSWLRFYLPGEACIEQTGQRIRWINMPPPPAHLLQGNMLLISNHAPDNDPATAGRFGRIEKVADLKRLRGPLTIEIMQAYLLAEPVGEVIDMSPPPELAGRP